MTRGHWRNEYRRSTLEAECERVDLGFSALSLLFEMFRLQWLPRMPSASDKTAATKLQTLGWKAAHGFCFPEYLAGYQAELKPLHPAPELERYQPLVSSPKFITILKCREKEIWILCNYWFYFGLFNEDNVLACWHLFLRKGLWQRCLKTDKHFFA